MALSARLLAALVPVTLGGCLGAAGRPVLAPPPARDASPGFPARAEDPDVGLTAHLLADPARVLGSDLSRHGLLPVAVRIGRRPGGRAGLFLDDTGAFAELVLQDGTRLAQVPDPRPPWADARLLDALRRTRLEPALLPDQAAAREGLLFFRFAPERVRVRGTRALSRIPGAERELDLFASLLRVEVRGPAGPRTLHVGLRSARWEGE